MVYKIKAHKSLNRKKRENWVNIEHLGHNIKTWDLAVDSILSFQTGKLISTKYNLACYIMLLNWGVTDL